MNKTAIEWCDYSANPIKGLCPMGCRDLGGDPYCYARAMYHRFKWNPEIRHDVQAWYKPIAIHRTKPGRIFVCSTIEAFHPAVPEDMRKSCLAMAASHPQHTFIFLTKRPWELQKYNPWPRNCWVGTTLTDSRPIYHPGYLSRVDANMRFLSLEPLLGPMRHTSEWLQNIGINWIILGGRTGRKKFHPPEEWIREIEDAADAAGIPVFEKPNLRPRGPFRQERPRRE